MQNSTRGDMNSGRGQLLREGSAILIAKYLELSEREQNAEKEPSTMPFRVRCGVFLGGLTSTCPCF